MTRKSKVQENDSEKNEVREVKKMEEVEKVEEDEVKEASQKRTSKNKRKEKKKKSQKLSDGKENEVTELSSSVTVVESKEVESKEVESKEVESKEESPNTPNENSSSGSEVETQLSELHAFTDTSFNEIIDFLKDNLGVFKKVQTLVSNLKKQVEKERKETVKLLKKMNKGQRKKKKGGNKSPGGFTKPTPLSSSMCAFLGLEEGSELARTDVTKEINKYIKNHQLQNPDNKKNIIPDSKLKNLLHLEDDDELTYFNLQKFLKVHFPKKESVQV
jgi:chromatin remodeling complex protein RSC6